MGYYATGDGYLKLKSPLPDDVNYDIFEYHYCTDKDLSVSFYDKYYENDVYDFCDEIAPYVEEGAINFVGEDNANWRFVFRNNNWTEESARLVYDSDPEITLTPEAQSDLIKQLIECFTQTISDGKPSDSIIEGAKFDQLSDRLHDTLVEWHIL